MKKFGEKVKVFFLDRDNINTDEIIPAKYLTEIEKEPLKPHLLEDLNLDGLDPEKINWSEYGAIVSRRNFGSGSSREMAVWAFEVNNIYVIIAENFARIFRENCFNDGILAIELGDNKIKEIFDTYRDIENVTVQVDFDAMILKFQGKSIEKAISFELNKLQKELIAAGGWVELAVKKY